MKRADMIFYNGRVYSMNSEKNICDAFVVSDGKFIYAGSKEKAMTYKDTDTECVDLKGKSVIPGLGDAHLHASFTCELLFSFNMYGIGLTYDASPEEALDKYKDIIKEQAGKNKSAVVLRGTGWDPGYFMADTELMPKAKDIDAVCADVPVILRSYDHHYIWVNSKVLKDSGITKETETPRNGVIWRDEEGNPTGIFQENTAINLLLGSVPYGDYTVDEYEKGILYYRENYGNLYGTTFIFDALATENALTAYKNLANADKLSMRVGAVYATDPSRPMSQMEEIIAQKGKEDIGDTFRRDTVKVFADGTGLSIYMDEPYEAGYLKSIGMEEGYCGYPQWKLEEMTEIFVKANNAGMPVHVHCMGDGAARMTLDAIEAAKAQGADVENMRNTIAHFMAIRKEDILRMAKLNIIANVQPIWGCRYSMTDTIITDMIGEKRALSEYPMASFKRAGVVMASGTDFPVILPPSPYLGFKVAVTRTVDKGHPEYEAYKDKPLGPKEDPMSEAISIEDIIEVYSMGAAYQMSLEKTIGSIEEGKSADFVILDKNIPDVDPEDYDSLQTEKLYFKGECVYRKEA